MSSKVIILVAASTLTLLTLVGSCYLLTRDSNTPISQAEAAEPVSPQSHLFEPAISPIIPVQGLDLNKVALGHDLFEDKRLSHDNTLACASCHGLDTAGQDGHSHSVGIGGQLGGVNAPTVLNSGLNFVQFWNGRSPSLEDQVNGPTHNPKEMGSNWPEIVGKLKQDPQFVSRMTGIYPSGVRPENIRDAIATFERSLTTPNSAFDKYLAGDTNAMSPDAVAGYQLFVRYGCSSCHQGENIGGNMYQKFGVMGDYFHDRGNINDNDLGHYAVTHRDQDKYVFRVPSLRNVALTAPYFHDGTAATLPDAVEVMGIYQLGRPLKPKEVSSIVSFLDDLTGDQPNSK